jgi:hypothetical protein
MVILTRKPSRKRSSRGKTRDWYMDGSRLSLVQVLGSMTLQKYGAMRKNAFGTLQKYYLCRRIHPSVPHTPCRRTRCVMPLFIKYPRLDCPLGCHRKFNVGALQSEHGGRVCAEMTGGSILLFTKAGGIEIRPFY